MTITSVSDLSISDESLIIENLCLTLTNEQLAFEKKLLENENLRLQHLLSDKELEMEMLREQIDELDGENQDLHMEVTELQEEIADLTETVNDMLEG
ncbi:MULTISPECIES: hypothetical protein [Xanthocytophaga]|uniref:Uncharacterized protein n=1 Tax=Xanthocytophaga agilis TaxID=3048010 RepID=A0AAE3R7Z0_9BACT|nr:MULTISPECIES: hypothetical protein [Xanthocytophaga]MDJ1471872.1 hypothetical protein [Xanthocytophaga flavus]MDJ1505424.1 hypothetical protein [Xanthocytophaga agilis]